MDSLNQAYPPQHSDKLSPLRRATSGPLSHLLLAQGLLVFLLLISCGSWTQAKVLKEPVRIAQTDPKSSTEVPPETTPPLTEQTSSAPVSTTPQPKDWTTKIDEAFGKYVVGPFATLVFYDFHHFGVPEMLGTSFPFVVAWLFLGAVFFTLRMGFINFRGFKHAIRLTLGEYDDPNEPGEVSHFQALASALSATVGLGNIAGVAIAVGQGGPGAVFWLILAGLLGMSSKFSECSLGLLYRKVSPDGVVSGGPMHYLPDGLAEMGLKPLGMVLGVLFTIMCIGGSFGGGCAFQVGQSLGAIKQEIVFLQGREWIYGLVMALLTATVILGGIRRIASTADKIVPFMCGLYILVCGYILLLNYSKFPEAIASIFHGAFTGDGIKGGVLGVMVIGIKRAAFSNEAGVGSAAIAHSAAKTKEPISEGIVALLEPFIDTVVVCTMTGLVIVITGVYADPNNAHLIASDEGAILTSRAFGGVVSWFPILLALTVFLFAFSTVISWSYYGERCWTRLFGPRSSLVYKFIFIICTFLGSIITATNVKDFSDLMILSMAFPNILGVALLSGRVRRELDLYWGKYQRGEFVVKSKSK